MDKQAEIKRIKAEYEARNREIDRQHRQKMAKIIGGGLLQGASFHPIFNIPYVGTGLGGAMFEAGNAIMQGKSGKDILSDAGKGFVVGETVGAIPYAGKGLSKTKVGQTVAKSADDLVKRLADTPIVQKVEDVLLNDITGKSIKAYHGTPHNFDEFDFDKVGTTTDSGMFGNGFYFTEYPEIAKNYAKNNGYIKKANLEFKKPLVINTKSQLDEIDSIVDARVPNETFEDMINGPQNYSKAFKDYVFENGYDSVIDNVGRKGEQYVAFKPEQIKVRDLQNYVKNVNMGTFINALLNEQE